MSAPLIDPSPSSISSSGHRDGLGRRSLTFDRETGAMLERLHLRPELAAFEAAIRARVDQLASFEDERFARPGSVERDPGSGDLTVLSEFVAGSRLSDLLETAEEGGVVPGVDVALGFLLESLPAIGCFHTAAGFSHGLIAPTRIVASPAGQVVFLDTVFGSVVERLGLSKRRLSEEFGIAPPSSGPVRFDVAADMAQLALVAVMLVIGRRLQPGECPDSLPSLLMDVIEVAQIRGSSLFATSLQRLLQRSLPLPGRRPFATADEFANEIRLLLRREIGADVCRRALATFAEQMDAEVASMRAAPQTATEPLLDLTLPSGDVLTLDSLALEALDSIEVLDIEDDEGDATEGAARDSRDEEPEFEEILLDSEPAQPITPPAAAPAVPFPSAFDTARPDDDSASAIAEPNEVDDPWSFDRTAADRADRAVDEAPLSIEPPPPAPVQQAAAPAAPTEASREVLLSETPPPQAAEPPPSGSEAAAASATYGQEAQQPALQETTPAGATAETATDAADAPAPEPESPSISPRRKKRQFKSARARKDKLRSAVAQNQQNHAKPAARPASGWLVNPDRAAAFAPPVVDTPSAPAPGQPVAAPAALAAPMPAVQPPVPQPIVAPPRTAIPMPVYGAPSATPPVLQPPAPPVVPPPVAARPAPPARAAVKPVAPAGAPLRIKAEAPAGYAPPRQSTIAPPPHVQRAMFDEQPSRGFPVKLAVAVLVIVGIAIVAGRAYLPSTAEVEHADPPAAEAAAGKQPEPAVVVMPKIETGNITIETQPTGARVLLDGKPVGQSPLKLADVPVGRHTLTFVSPSGQVTRTVPVQAGRTETLEVSIFSGWVAVYAPVVLEMSIDGRSLGTTEQERLMLPPGRHDLTLTNRELGYKATQQVDILPGEVRSVTIDPRGEVNFNAVPWAEVWMDGKKLGDTPLAKTRVPIGTREFVFRHPELGERKVTATVRADEPVAIGVDFTRPQ